MKMPGKIFSVVRTVLAVLIVVSGFLLVWGAPRNTNRKIVDSRRPAEGNTANTNSSSTVLSSTAYLDEIAEPHLSAAAAIALVTKAENVNAYQVGSSDQLGGLDCGQSVHHDQIVTLNAGLRRSFLAHDSLLVTATPNSFNWTSADLRVIADDSTAVCGVGTTIPRAVVGSWVIWWNTCVSGMGPPQRTQPDYQMVVRCLQAQEVLDRNYHWAD